MNDDIRVYIRHARQVEYCTDGLRKFCKKYNLDLIRICSGGISVKELLATGDSMAIRIANVAIREHEENS